MFIVKVANFEKDECYLLREKPQTKLMSITRVIENAEVFPSTNNIHLSRN